jgi:hypothetical protein
VALSWVSVKAAGSLVLGHRPLWAKKAPLAFLSPPFCLCFPCCTSGKAKRQGSRVEALGLRAISRGGAGPRAQRGRGGFQGGREPALAGPVEHVAIARSNALQLRACRSLGRTSAREGFQRLLHNLLYECLFLATDVSPRTSPTPQRLSCSNNKARGRWIEESQRLPHPPSPQLRCAFFLWNRSSCNCPSRSQPVPAQHPALCA